MVYEPLCLATDNDPVARRIADLCDAAFAAYRTRRFQEAAETFARVQSILPGDGAASVLEMRCRTYVASPPPENWTGAHVATEK